MQELNYLNDKLFLQNLDKEHIKVFYTAIVILDKNDIPIREIIGRATSGNISLSLDFILALWISLLVTL